MEEEESSRQELQKYHNEGLEEDEVGHAGRCVGMAESTWSSTSCGCPDSS